MISITVDESVIDQMIDDIGEKAWEIMDMLLDDMDTSILDIEADLRTGRVDSSKTHKLRGIARSIGAVRIDVLTKEIETSTPERSGLIMMEINQDSKCLRRFISGKSNGIRYACD